jgi:arabinose-5-phosphate isomerase
MSRLAEDGAKALARGREVLQLEAAAVAAVAGRLDERFARAVRLVAGCTGRIIVSGVGKSGLIARKIAATMTSTGTAASFVHPVDSLHGDLGTVGRNDVAVVLSKSGETEELFGLVAQLKRLGVPIIAMVGEPSSTLARHADVVLDAAVESEACPFDLAPTTSTTVALALGDALAVTAYEARGFKPEDFAALHPGGALGRRLLLTVGDVMVREDLPVLGPDASMRQCVVLLAERRGTVAVVDGGNVVVGVVTSGDLTRLMERRDDFLEVPVGEVMTRTPKLAHPDEVAGAVVLRMEQKGIMAMPVVDEAGKLAGIVHLHDLLRAGAA